ncbi:MAG TPA: phosphatidylglycerophosphatase A [Chitinophagaceae bacterium]|nr:phosphatidylglycerophosphatase A [Chitinophagaceae bacterium]
MMVSKMIATCGGIGYVKGGGTIAAAVYTILWLLIRPSIVNMPVQVVVFIALLVAGVWVANTLEQVWGKDSHRIVIDEAAGMCCTLLFVPHSWPFALLGLAAFRFFDIVKPLYIRNAEKLPGGWGVMADDVAAGICANLLLQLVMVTNLI